MKSPDVTNMQPECPYCGEPMELRVECSICRLPVSHPDYWPCAPEWNYRVSFVCRACTTRTFNTLHSPVEHAETEEEALAKAYSSATKKRKEYETNIHHLIQHLEDHLREATKKVQQLEAERDAAVADITRMVQEPYDPCYCDYCKLTEEECAKSNCRGRNAFVWRGVQKEATP